ncbi:MAG: histidine--tRNA ligase [Candidatus Dormibacteraceae bacterium]
MPPLQPIHATRGVRDLLPADRATWQIVEAAAAQVAESFGYQEIQTPIIEPAELVERGVGDTTDVVSKELYKFEDRGGRWIVLRPEGTAGTLRAYFEGNLNQGPQPARLFTHGPMFRYDRPQAGRYRQLHQFNVEAIGEASPVLDAEVIELAWAWYRTLGLGRVTLQLNSIGDWKCRPGYRESLLAYFRPLRDQLCHDCQERLEVNPLRLLDCKTDRALVERAPLVTDHLCDECRAAFAEVRAMLEVAGIPYQLNPRLVRGLDYYTRTAFEFWHESLGGAQNALGGGGRYDGLAEAIGWPATPAVGFAAGLDRTIGVLGSEGIEIVPRPAAEVLVVTDGPGLAGAAAAVARIARQVLPAMADYSERSLKAKMRAANRVGTRYVLLMNGEEAERNVVQVREMATGEQREVAWADLSGVLE